MKDSALTKVLGPFPTRGAALDAEVTYLQTYVL